jgi:hypothetical protein
VDNSVDGIFTEAVANNATGKKPCCSFFTHGINHPQNRQLQRDENGSTKRVLGDSGHCPIVHKHLVIGV